MATLGNSSGGKRQHKTIAANGRTNQPAWAAAAAVLPLLDFVSRVETTPQDANDKSAATHYHSSCCLLRSAGKAELNSGNTHISIHVNTPMLIHMISTRINTHVDT